MTYSFISTVFKNSCTSCRGNREIDPLLINGKFYVRGMSRPISRCPYKTCTYTNPILVTADGLF